MKTNTKIGFLAGLLTMVLHASLWGQVSFANAAPVWDAKNNLFFTDSQGWNQPEYGTTIMFADIDKDGRADICGRSSAGIICQRWTGNSLSSPYQASQSPDFSDAAFWNQSSVYYGTIRFADIDGDGYPDICGRSPDGIVCARNTGKGMFEPATLRTNLTFFSDAHSANEVQYATTVMFADIGHDHKADVCIRRPQGVICEGNQNDGYFANDFLAVGEFADDPQKMDHLNKYGTIRFADVDGDGYPDICGREAVGIVCYKNDGSGHFPSGAQMETSFSDLAFWIYSPYSTTIMYADINGDGKADVCGRGPDGVICELATGLWNANGFGQQQLVTGSFADSDGDWAKWPAYYGSIKFADINGDGKPDICGRRPGGIYCAINTSK